MIFCIAVHTEERHETPLLRWGIQEYFITKNNAYWLLIEKLIMLILH